MEACRPGAQTGLILGATHSSLEPSGLGRVVIQLGLSHLIGQQL